MDKQIIDKLIGMGLITQSGVDYTQIKDLNDLLHRGIITTTISKTRLSEILNMHSEEEIKETVEQLIDNAPVIDDTPSTEPVIDDTPSTEPVIDDTPSTEPEIIVEDNVEDNININKTTKKTRTNKKQ